MLRAYQLDARTVEMPFGKLDAIVLGDTGRGRKQEIVPCPLGLADGDLVAVSQSRTGKPKIVRSAGQPSGWLMRINTHGAYIRNAFGHVRLCKGRAEVVARGSFAFGDAGRIGVAHDIIVRVDDDSLVLVKPTRAPFYYLAVLPDRVMRIEQNQIDLALEALGWEAHIAPYTTAPYEQLPVLNQPGAPIAMEQCSIAKWKDG